MYQVQYNYYNKLYQWQEINQVLYLQAINATEFLNTAAFNLAHWLFAYNYWALSWRVELIKNRMSPDIYNCRLNTINIVVSLITVLIPAIDWVLFSYPKLNRTYLIVGLLGNVWLAISCIFLVWGFQRLIKTV